MRAVRCPNMGYLPVSVKTDIIQALAVYGEMAEQIPQLRMSFKCVERDSQGITTCVRLFLKSRSAGFSTEWSLDEDKWQRYRRDHTTDALGAVSTWRQSDRLVGAKWSPIEKRTRSVVASEFAELAA